MSRKRIIYQDWIVELGHDPSVTWAEPVRHPGSHSLKIIEAVNRAMSFLNEDEVSFIRAFYIQGMTYRQISAATERAIYKLESLHRGALRKLKKNLHHLLGRKYHIPKPEKYICPLCDHPRSDEINRLIKSKTNRDTWKPVIRILRREYGVELSTTQILVGHHKYHML